MGQTGAGAYSGMPGMAGALVSGALSPYTNGRDPRSGCDSSGLPGQGLGYSAARGYQYSIGQAESLQGRKRNFDFGDFFQGMLTKGVTEGLSSAGSFGLGKVLDAVKRGIQGRKNRVSGGSRGGTLSAAQPNHGQGFSPKGYNPQPGERTFEGYVNNNVPKDVETRLFTHSSGFNTNPKNDGHFKRFGTEPNQHGIAGVHVHQPTRNVNPNNGMITGKPGTKTKNGGVTTPGAKDVKQLYEYLENDKYH